jgi:type I restriction enzyme S subunit
MREASLTSLLERGLANGRSVQTRLRRISRPPASRHSTVARSIFENGARCMDRRRSRAIPRTAGVTSISRGNGSLHLVGRGGLVAEDPDPVAFPDTLIRARPRTDLMNAGVLSHSCGIRRGSSADRASSQNDCRNLQGQPTRSRSSPPPGSIYTRAGPHRVASVRRIGRLFYASYKAQMSHAPVLRPSAVPSRRCVFGSPHGILDGDVSGRRQD